MYLIYDVISDNIIDLSDTIEQARLLLNYYESFYDEQCNFEIIIMDDGY